MSYLKTFKFFLLKIKFVFFKNINLPRKGRIPLSSKFDISKKSKCNIKCIEVNENVYIRVRKNANLKIGEGVFFNNNCILTCRKQIEIGDNVIFGPNVMIFDHDHDIHSLNLKDEYICEKIIIEDNCWIGANCIILKGTHIKKNTVIAAGSIVRGIVNENVIYYNKVEKREKKIERGIYEKK